MARLGRFFICRGGVPRTMPYDARRAGAKRKFLDCVLNL
jgi:hypothetical protein